MPQTINLGSLTIDVELIRQEVHYRFNGPVGDTFKHSDVPLQKADKIILNLQGITSFNSCGIREWVYLIREFAKLGQIVFTKCSIAMVDQFNMVPESMGKGAVESFFSPYVCEEHGEVDLLVIVNDQLKYLELGNAPVAKCEHCGEELIFDAMPESYFLFLNQSKSGLSQAS